MEPEQIDRTEKRCINFIYDHPAFLCPACKHPHYLDTRWKFNGDRDRPSFLPAFPGARNSYLQFTPEQTIKGFRIERPGKAGQDIFDTEDEALVHIARFHPNDQRWKVVPTTITKPRQILCHSHIIDGEVRFCGDQPGGFANKVVPLQEWALDDFPGWG